MHRVYIRTFFVLSILFVTHNGQATINYARLNQETFTTIYRLNVWGDTESASGPGSNTQQTQKIREWLPEILKKLQIHVLLDAPCGDFNWMKEVDLSLLTCYIGVDIVPDLIIDNIKRYNNARAVFLHKDITKDPLPYVDAIICRDCLTHLSFNDIAAALKNFKKSGARYLITSKYPARDTNDDMHPIHLMHLLRYRPLNLEKPPFNFPAPLAIVSECNTEGAIPDKSIAVWEIKDLPIGE
jgi:hypothetical protein